MKSMTGYGRASASLGAHTLTVQVSSVNRKALDLTMKLPREWDGLEPVVGELVRKHATRGKVHVVVEWGRLGGDGSVDWDEEAAAALFKRLAAFASSRGVAFTPTPELLLTLLNTQKKDATSVEQETIEPVLRQTLEEALKAFVAMRTREGEALLADLLARVDTLARQVDAVAARAPSVVATYRESLLKRLRDAGLALDVNDERVLKEIALFADRCDVAEELTRLRSHLGQFTALLKSGGEIGRKAEFILQEIGREVNTIGSKANDLEIAKAVIEAKNELERVKEQIANVE